MPSGFSPQFPAALACARDWRAVAVCYIIQGSAQRLRALYTEKNAGESA